MKWFAGPQGGGWYALTQELVGLIQREIPGLDIGVATGGGRENPLAIQAGDAQLAMSVDFLVAAAHAGRAPYEGSPNPKIATLGTGWAPLPFHLLRAETVGADLRAAILSPGFRIAIPPKDTSDELTFRRILAFYETSYARIRDNGGHVVFGDYDNIAAAIRGAETDYLFGATTKPAQVIRHIGEGPRRVMLADMPKDLMRWLGDTFGYGRGIIPEGTYPTLQQGPIETIFMETVFMISTDVPEEDGYQLMMALLRNYPELAAKNAILADFDPAKAATRPSAPLHPGAARALRDLGFPA